MEQELKHFGVKGMHWGVRKYIDKNGNITDLGKKHEEAVLAKKTLDNTSFADTAKIAKANKAYAVASHKEALAEIDAYEKKGASNRFKHLTEKYKAKGESEDESKIHAYNREKREAILTIVGGTVLTAATAYAAYHHYDKVTDRLIKEGETIGRIEDETYNGSLHDSFYAFHNKADAVKYRGMYGDYIMSRGYLDGPPKELSMKVKNGGLKIASQENARKALSELVNENPSVKSGMIKSFNEVAKYDPLVSRQGVLNKAVKDLGDNKVTDNVYNAMNFGLVTHSPEQQKLNDSFYKKLKSKGYDAIRDINDKSFSGYGSKDPIVVFAKDKVDVSRVSQLSKDFIESNNQKAMNEIMVRNLAPAFAAVPAAAALKKGLTSNNDKPAQDFIKEYKHEHPNTKMSNSQILKSVTGGK